MRGCRFCGESVREGRSICGGCSVDTGDGLLDLSEPLPKWIDGPKLLAWVQEHGLENTLQYGEGWARRMNEWKRGAVTSVHTADRLLTQMGLHLSELPDDFWVPHPHSAEARAAA